jgi:hypothetical protein
LLHDAGNCIAAFPGGIEGIKQGKEWRDVVAQWKQGEQSLMPGALEYQCVLLEVLRLLHPQQAPKLAKISWLAPGESEPMCLLEDKELRDYYAVVMGEIAASHGLPSHEIERFAAQRVHTPACLHPAKWSVDVLKIAALLRATDAAHLDATRAPKFLYALTQPQGTSDSHWRFQSKLGAPAGDGELSELVFSSGGQAFSQEERDAWWLCYDTCVMVDKELRAIDQILRENQRQPFALRAVRGISDPSRFADYVRTDGWHPVDTSLRISDVASVVENFGGEKLYGNKPWLALRELLQNSADAVRACRSLGGFGPKEGRIDVELEEMGGEEWLHVSDNGIGMSRYVLTHTLLDFGKSLWRSNDAWREWPGLAGSGFQATGQFGIGFFSVFMLGDAVKIASLPYGKGHESCHVLEFNYGLHQRPLLRPPGEDEALKRHGTRISVRLKKPSKKGLLSIRRMGLFITGKKRGEPEPAGFSLQEIVAAMVPALDIDVWSEEAKSGKVSCVKPNDWQTLSPENLLQRLLPIYGFVYPIQGYIENPGKRMLSIQSSEGELLGRGALTVEQQLGILVVNGIYAGNAAGIAGVLVSRQNIDLARSQAIPVAGADEMASWVNQQCTKMEAKEKTQWLAACALSLGGEVADWPLVYSQDGVLDRDGLKSSAKKYAELWLVESLTDYDYDNDAEFSPNEFGQNLQTQEKCLEDSDVLWRLQTFIDDVEWPPRDIPTIHHRRLIDAIVEILEEEWGGVTVDEPKEQQIVGHVNGQPVYRGVKILRKA